MTAILAHLVGPVFAPAQIIVPVLLGIAYAKRAHTLAGTRREVPIAKQACFMSGLVLIVATLTSPIGHIADELFAVHMAEHLLIADIGALLLALGLTGPLLAPILKLRGIGWLRIVTNPLVALPLWTVDFYAWHLPGPYQAAVAHEWIHALEHTMFIACGMAMWMALLGPLPRPAWFGNFAKLVYILAVRLLGAVLANILVWAGHPIYPKYALAEASWHVKPLTDQIAGGAIMMVEGSIVTLCLFGWLFLRAAQEGEERQELLDLAAANGVALDEARAARAVAAGRGAELRERLTGG